MNKITMLTALFLLCHCIFVPNPATGQTASPLQPTTSLFNGFVNPPQDAKPRTWWHWTGGNVTKEGITKDLEWMKRVGIGGFMMFDVSFGSGQNIDKKIVFFTPEWFDALRHAASEADRLGLEMTLHTSAGWSETGGPWVKPEEAIKKLTWSETQIEGSKKISVQLPVPPSVTGPIREMARQKGMLGGLAAPDPTFYADAKTIAYRTPDAEKDMANLQPKTTSSFGDIDAANLLDDNLSTKQSVPVPTINKPVWIQYEFNQPFQARALSIALALTGNYGSSNMRPGSLSVSDDGENFRTIISLPGAQHDIRALPVRTFSIPETTARYFRIEFVTGSGITTVGGPDGRGYGGAEPNKTFDLLEARLIVGGRVNRWEDKANFAPMFEYETIATPMVPSSATVNPAEVVDLTSKVSADGTLNWDAPAGRWTVMRMGYSLTGAKNGPAIPEGTGFESDKLNKDHLTSYYHYYTDRIKQAVGPFYGKSLQYLLVDSYEADAQNWTDDMIAEFKARRGYDPVPYLPALAGRIVGCPEISDRFLWDFRLTISDLLTDEHYGTITKLAHDDGLKIYSEAAGISLPIIQDALANKGKVDIPMGEFGMTQGLGNGTGSWMSPFDLEAAHSWRGAADRLNAHQSDIREAASASHIYGKKLVATESWTGGGYEAPSAMKLIGDYWNTQGVNRFIFHTSAHQPLDTKPGNVMVGAHINRNITWAEQATPFMTYLARNSYMLQQGNFVADIVYYLGESIPSAVPYWEKLKPEPPAGYDYDFINTEILLGSASVEDGMIVLKSGMKYRVMALPETNVMTPKVLNKIKELIAAGATVIGPKPEKSPSLAGYPNADKEVASLANEIWGDTDGKMVYHHSYGKGNVYWGIPLTGPLVDLKVAKDLDYTRPNFNTYLSWIHRQAENTDIYFITNMRNQTESLNMSLRVTGKIPELWHSDTGKKELVSYSIKDGKTLISLTLNPQESVFVVLGEPAQQQELVLPKTSSTKLTDISGEWKVSFQPNLGAPAFVTFPKLESWAENTDEGVKYYSGTATYTKEFEVEKGFLKASAKFELDLGEVRDIAEVVLNGKPLGILWKAPYKTDVTGILKLGNNKLEIKVTNEWNNRIAGDKKLPPEKKVLSQSTGGRIRIGSDAPANLERSGLIGPVQIFTEK